MALERNLDVVSYPASADLSASLFHIVTIDSNGRVAVSAGSTSKIFGVLQSKPKVLGEGAAVAIGGVTKCVAGGAIAEGDFVTSNAQGFGLATTTAGNVAAGRAATEAAGSGEIFELQIMPQMVS
jgi:hypothetical protein